ncbi:MAG: cation diffusion facilitator family transporter [Phycisphaerales bacterium]|nr:cation diffusion facilitator family transporter [Phycisphaerales bacterium]
MAASGTKVVIYAALAGNGLIAITKFIAAGFTGSAAMFAEGIHSVVDTGNQGLLLYGLKRSKKPACERFPFGHGKEVYFWSFVVAILIFALGSGISLYEGIHRVMHPSEVTSPLINYLVLGAALIFEGVAWYLAYREFRVQQGERSFTGAIKASKDPITFVVLFEDSAAMLGLVVAGVGLTLNQVLAMPIFDGLASIAIGLILAGTAICLALRTKSLLIGEAADPELVEDVRQRAAALPASVGVNEVLTLHMGPHFVLLTVSIDFADAMPVGEVEKTVERLTRDIREAHPDIKRVFIEAESKADAKASEVDN